MSAPGKRGEAHYIYIYTHTRNAELHKATWATYRSSYTHIVHKKSGWSRREVKGKRAARHGGEMVINRSPQQIQEEYSRTWRSQALVSGQRHLGSELPQRRSEYDAAGLHAVPYDA